MIAIFSAANRHHADIGWLQSRPVYAFGPYQDDTREGFGVMRVCNDDVIAPDTGFGAHPHSDMEIVSIVLEGRIRHEDNLGNEAVSAFGEVQRMSAGSGIIHTEFNDSDTEQLRLLQLWFMPQERGMAPSYETSRYNPADLIDSLYPIVSGQPLPSAASIGQNVTIYLGRPQAGCALEHKSASGRKQFLYVIGGKLLLEASDGSKAELAEQDVAEAEGLKWLRLTAEEDAFIMLIDL